MTTRIDNDGPAYPFEIENKSTEDIPDIFGGVVKAGTTRIYSGLTLRDTFAINALSVVAMGHFHQGEQFIRIEEYRNVATHAYLMADAMLRARTQGETDAS